MKILFFFVGHRQLEEYKLQSFFFKQFKMIKDFDVIIYSNASHELETLQEYCKDIPNIIEFLPKQRNTGYVRGLFTALEDNFDKFQRYDMVIHLHPDIFITDDSQLYSHMKIMDWLNFDLLASPSLHTMNYDVEGLGYGDPLTNQNCFHATDLFVFKPKSIDKGFFDTSFWGEAEHIFTHNITKYNLKVLQLLRISKVLPDHVFTKDSCEFWHSHDLQSVREAYQIKN